MKMARGTRRNPRAPLGSIPFIRSFLLGALLVSASACCHADLAPAVAVREAQVRSEELRLPLDQAGRDHLLAFLAAGGNRDLLEEGDLVDLGASQRYGPLLELLSSAENLDASDLQSAVYKPWFKSEPQRQVIDARAARPPVDDPPFAVSDGRYWWVFSRDGGEKFTRLVVFQASHKPGKDEGMSP